MVGGQRTNPMGRALERFLQHNDICLLNNGSGTRLDLNTGDTSSPDVTLCSPEIITRLEWRVYEEKFGSDHFAILVDDVFPVTVPTIRRFNVSRARWSSFKQLAVVPENVRGNADDMLETFETVVNNAALETIPHTFGGIGRIPVPWWNECCARTRREKKVFQRRYHRYPTVENKVALNRARAEARKAQRQARKQCWIDYINTINSKTPLNNIFKMMKKMKGRYMGCLLYTSPSPRDKRQSRMPSSA